MAALVLPRAAAGIDSSFIGCFSLSPPPQSRLPSLFLSLYTSANASGAISLSGCSATCSAAEFEVFALREGVCACGQTIPGSGSLVDNGFCSSACPGSSSASAMTCPSLNTTEASASSAWSHAQLYSVHYSNYSSYCFSTGSSSTDVFATRSHSSQSWIIVVAVCAVAIALILAAGAGWWVWSERRRQLRQRYITGEPEYGRQWAGERPGSGRWDSWGSEKDWVAYAEAEHARPEGGPGRARRRSSAASNANVPQDVLRTPGRRLLTAEKRASWLRRPLSLSGLGSAGRGIDASITKPLPVRRVESSFGVGNDEFGCMAPPGREVKSDVGHYPYPADATDRYPRVPVAFSDPGHGHTWHPYGAHRPLTLDFSALPPAMVETREVGQGQMWHGRRTAPVTMQSHPSIRVGQRHSHSWDGAGTLHPYHLPHTPSRAHYLASSAGGMFVPSPKRASIVSRSQSHCTLVLGVSSPETTELGHDQEDHLADSAEASNSEESSAGGLSSPEELGGSASSEGRIFSTAEHSTLLDHDALALNNMQSWPAGPAGGGLAVHVQLGSRIMAAHPVYPAQRYPRTSAVVDGCSVATPSALPLTEPTWVYALDDNAPYCVAECSGTTAGDEEDNEGLRPAEEWRSRLNSVGSFGTSVTLEDRQPLSLANPDTCAASSKSKSLESLPLPRSHFSAAALSSPRPSVVRSPLSGRAAAAAGGRGVNGRPSVGRLSVVSTASGPGSASPARTVPV